MKNVLKSLVILMFFLACKPNEHQKTLDTNFVHVVYIWLNDPDNPKDRNEFEDKLNTFLNASKYAKTKYVGTPAMTDREVVDNSYSYCLVVSFASKEDQDKYQVEPAHVKFVEEAQHLWKRVQVYDSNVLK